MKRPNWRRIQRHVFQAAAIAAIATGCGQGNGGCALTTGIQPLAAPLPKEAILENGIQIRLTNQGFAFVEQNLNAIVQSLIGDHICIGANSFSQGVDVLGVGLANANLCPSNPVDNPPGTQFCDGAPGCRVDFNLQNVDFTLDQNGNSALLRNQITMDASSLVTLDVTGFLVPDTTCSINVSAQDFLIDATIALSVDATSRHLKVNLTNMNLADIINTLGIDITGGFVCDLGDASISLLQSTIANFVINLFQPTLINLVNGQIQNFVPNPPGIEGRIDLGQLLGGALPIPIQGQFELSMVAGGYAKSETTLNNLGGDPAQRGLSLGMRTGLNSDFTPPTGVQNDPGLLDGRSTPHPCVRTLPLPLPGVPSQFVNGERFLERAGEFAGNSIPGVANSFDAGLGVSKAFLNNFGFHMFNSGMLCIGVGSETLGADLLSSQTLGLLLGSINDLVKTPGGVMPIFIQLRPQTPPTVSLGTGAANDPLIRLSLKNLNIDLFALVDERLARLLTASTSFDLGINIAIDPNFPNPDGSTGAFIPTLDTSQLLNLTVAVSNSELLQEPPDSVASILPTLIQVALPALANVIGPIAPPSVGGFRLDLSRTSIQKVSANLGAVGTEDFLGVFAGLLFDASGKANVTGLAPVQIKAQLADVLLPETFALNNRQLALEDLPGVQLHLIGDSDTEWQFRVDNGIWTPFTQDADPILRQPIFMLQGEHKIEVRGRTIDQAATLSDISIVKVLIDTVEPKMSLTPTEDGSIRATISDVGTGFNDLERMYRVDSNDWAQLPVDGVITPEMMTGGLTVEVMATDKAGHSVTKSMDRLRGASLASTTAACSVSPAEEGLNALLGLGAVLGFLLVMRRKQYRALGSSMMVAAAITSEGCACGGVACFDDSDCAALSCNVGETGLCGTSGFCECGQVVIENGDVGRFSDVAVDGTEAVIVAYNTSFGDLVLARVTPGAAGTKQSLEDFDFVYVDGVPSGPVVGDPNGIRDGIRDAGANVGQDASVAIDAQGNAHIAYLDVDKGNLKYARVGRDNTVQTVITVDAESFTGRYTDIIIGSNGNPQISYMAPNVGGFAQLRFVAANNANPTSTSDWQQPIIADSIAAVDPTPATLLDFPKGVGLFTSMTLRDGGRTRINYFDSINNDLKRTQTGAANPTNFADLAVANDPNGLIGVTKLDEDANGNDLGRIGKYASLATNGTAELHQVELNEDNSTLIYFGTASNFVIENVDNGVRDEGGNPVQHKVGGDATVLLTTLNGQSQLVAAYHDGTGLDTNVALRNADGTWTVHTVTGNESTFEGSKGFFTAFAVSNNPAIVFLVNYVLNQQDEVTDFELITLDLTNLP